MSNPGPIPEAPVPDTPYEVPDTPLPGPDTPGTDVPVRPPRRRRT